MPTANPFSKKRQYSEISKPEQPSNGAKAASNIDDDVSMRQHEELKSASVVSDAKMVSAAESSNEAASAVKVLAERSSNERVPNAKSSNTEDAWR